MRASLMILFALGIITLTGPMGCDRDASPDPSPEPRESADAEPSDPGQNPVVYGGDIEITVDDVARTVERLRLMAPEVAQGQIPDQDPEWMKVPQAQINIVQNLAHFKIVRLSAAERDISITPADEVSFLKDHEPLKRYLPLFQDGETADELRRELQTVGLDIDDIRHLAHDMILAERLKEQLAQEFGDDQLWALYQQSRDEADLVVARFRNTPESAEIDRAVEQYDAEIRAHYRDNRSRYRTPPRVRLTVLNAPSDSDVDDQVIADAARRLADEDPQAIADDLGLQMESGLEISRHENPEAQQAAVGDTGHTASDQRGHYAWRLEEKIDSETRPLDRPLRRQIGSRVLREQEGITPANQTRATAAKQILDDAPSGRPLDEGEISALVDALDAEGFEAVHTDYFSVRGSGVIPHIGLAEKVVTAVRELDLENPVTDPILERDSVHLARLVDRSHPDRDRFEAERDEFREKFLERNRDRLVDQHVRQYQKEHDISFNMQPVADHFGVIDKKAAPPQREGTSPTR